MALIREFELLQSTSAARADPASSIASVGQEATAVGACAALGPHDVITRHHRGHGHLIAKAESRGT